MTATLSKQADCISLVIEGKLGHDVWQTLRDARNTARSAGLPLRVDVQGCEQIERIGLGALLVAQEQLGSVQVTGCHDWLTRMFRSFGVCEHCSSKLSDGRCLGLCENPTAH